MKKWQKVILLVLAFAVAILGSAIVTMQLTRREQTPVEAKTAEIGAYLDTFFIDDYDEDKLADAAAAAMVEATGDRWSYYLTAEEKSTGNFPYNLPSITYFCLLLIFATVGLFLIKIILVNFLYKKRNFIILTRQKIKFFHFAARGSVIQIVLARTVYRFTCAFPNF